MRHLHHYYGDSELIFLLLIAGRSLRAAAVENIEVRVHKDASTPKEEGTMEADDDFSSLDYTPARKKTPIHN